MAALDRPVPGGRTAQTGRVEADDPAEQVDGDRGDPGRRAIGRPGGDAAQDRQRPADQAPREDALEVTLQRPALERDQREPAAPDLHHGVGDADGQPAPGERPRQGGRQDQAGPGQGEQQQPDRDALRVEPVGDPGGVDPQQPDHGQEQPGPQCAGDRLVRQHVVRELGHREHIDQVEEQLDVGDALGAPPGPHQIQRPGSLHAACSRLTPDVDQIPIMPACPDRYNGARSGWPPELKSLVRIVHAWHNGPNRLIRPPRTGVGAPITAAAR